MTLLEICKLIRHYIALFIAIVLIFTLIGFAFGYTKIMRSGETYTAKAVLTVVEPTGFVAADELMPLTEAIAANVLAGDDFSGAGISLEYDLKERTLSFTANGSTQDESADLANKAAAMTAELTESALQELAAQSKGEGEEVQIEHKVTDRPSSLTRSDINRALALESVVFTINDAAGSSSQSGMKGVLKYSIVGLVAGLFLAICLIVIVYLVKNPVRDRDEIEETFDIPVLADSSSNQLGLQLWANIQFAYEGKVPTSICLLPVEKAEVSGLDQKLLAAIKTLGGVKGMEKEERSQLDGIAVFACTPLKENIDAVYIAHEADVTVMVVKKWKDSMQQLANVSKQLAFAKANVAGIVLI